MKSARFREIHQISWNPADFMWNPPDFERPIARNDKPYVIIIWHFSSFSWLSCGICWVASGVCMVSEYPGVSWPKFCNIPVTFDTSGKDQKILNFHPTKRFSSKFLTLKVHCSRLVATRKTNLGSEHWLASNEELVTCLSTCKITVSTGHELWYPHYAHFYGYFSHGLSIERVKSISEHKFGAFRVHIKWCGLYW